MKEQDTTQTNHTPEPLEYIPGHIACFNKERAGAIINPEEGTVVAELTACCNGITDRTGTLMAAAPDLLAALLDALPYVEDVINDPEQLACFKRGTVQGHAANIRAAIAKARGLEG
jgi:hypothetical protein